MKTNLQMYLKTIDFQSDHSDRLDVVSAKVLVTDPVVSMQDLMSALFGWHRELSTVRLTYCISSRVDLWEVIVCHGNQRHPRH